MLMMAAVLPVAVNAEEIKATVDDSVNLAISVYNDNLALVKDTRKVSLKEGLNSVAFVGVAQQMKPETAIVNAQGLRVLEQNFDYNLINQQTMLKENIGKKVKTAMTDQQTGKTTFSEAVVIESEYGTVLQFDYGIDTNYPGRVIFDQLPSNLRTKPTFVVSLDNDKTPMKNIELSYLTTGMTWKADYVANVKDDKSLKLESFITLTNNSGVDYKNTAVQLISGTVNQVYNAMPAPRMTKAMGANMMMESAVMDSAYVGGIEQGSVGEYHVYTVPEKTTIKNQQTKQIKLFQSDDVLYEKEYRFSSPIGLSSYSGNDEFKKANPTTIYKIVNDKASNIGMPLPSGVVRFYNKDTQGNTQFIGESSIKQLAVNEEGELGLGVASDIFAKGKVVNAVAIAKNIKEFEVEVTIYNSKTEDVKVVYNQSIGNEWNVLSETHPSVKKSQNMNSWEIAVPKGGNVVLKFKVRVSRQES